MKAVIYSRVSTEKQDYERQISDIERYASFHNLTIVNHFEEKESGTIKIRKALTEMLDFVKNNQVDTVIVSELSRLGRTVEVVETVEKLSAVKVNLYSLKENLNTLNSDKSANETAKLIISIMASVNSHELSATKYRVISGLDNAVRKGHISGAQMPYGYTSVNKKLTIHPEQAEVVKEMFRLYIDGKGTGKICTILNHKDIKSQSGMKWRDVVVNRILHNPIYKGVRHYKEMVLEAPAIIDAETFDRVQEMFNNNEMRQGINKKFDFLFDNRKIRCGVCGKSYYAHKRSSGKDNTYVCISKRYRESCGNWGLNIDKLDSTVQEMVVLFTPESLIDAIDVAPLKDSIANLNAENEIFEAELRKLDLKEGKLVELLSEDNISKNVYLERREDIEKQRRDIVGQINANNERVSGMNMILHNSTDLIHNINEWKEKGISKEILNKVISKIVITAKPDLDLGSKVKNDKTIEVQVHLGTAILTYYVTRFSKILKFKEKD